MQERGNKYLKTGLTVFCTVAACILFFFVIYRYKELIAIVKDVLDAAEPIIIGFALAYLFMPVKKAIEGPAKDLFIKWKIKESKAKVFAKVASITAAILLLLIIIALLIAVLVPAVASSVVGLKDMMPKYIESFQARLKESGLAETPIGIKVSEYIAELWTALQGWTKTELLPFIQQYIGHITSGVFSVVRALFNFIVGIIVMVYVMSIEETLKGQSKKLVYAIFPAHRANVIIDTLRKSNDIFGGFVIGKIIDSAIIGVIAYIGCVILRMPSALLVAVIIGVTNVVPFFGPFIGAIPAVLLVFIQDPIKGLYLIIFILVLQQVDGNIIGPKILGDTTGLSSFWVLFSISLAGGLFGFFGMLLGVPIFAVIYYIGQELMRYRMRKKNLSNNTDDYVDLVAIDERTGDMIYKSERKKGIREDAKTDEVKENGEAKPDSEK